MVCSIGLSANRASWRDGVADDAQLPHRGTQNAIAQAISALEVTHVNVYFDVLSDTRRPRDGSSAARAPTRVPSRGSPT
jgi:hypothetical protein